MKQILIINNNMDEVSLVEAESLEAAATGLVLNKYEDDLQDYGINFVMELVDNLDVSVVELPAVGESASTRALYDLVNVEELRKHEKH